MKLLRPQISRVRWWIWFVATIVLILWIFERLLWPSSLFVSQWLVPTAFVLLVLSYYLQRSFWPPPLPPRDIKTRIVVVGAGPAGLSAAYFLRQQGYREVLVLEKLGHPGGLCRTITEDYHCFDLGANYVTPAYRETMNLADMVGAEMYVERPLTTIDLRESNASPKFVEPWSTVRNGMPALPYIGLCLKYMWLRFRLGGIINPPGHAAIHKHPELCIPFSEWLERNHLRALSLLFEAPITVMGYGHPAIRVHRRRKGIIRQSEEQFLLPDVLHDQKHQNGRADCGHAAASRNRHALGDYQAVSRQQFVPILFARTGRSANARIHQRRRSQAQDAAGNQGGRQCMHRAGDDRQTQREPRSSPRANSRQGA